MSRKPCKILYLSHSLGIGGLEVLLFELATRLDRRHFIPAACVMEAGGALEKEFLSVDIPVFHCPKGDGKDISFPYRFARLLKNEKIDILHTNNYSPWIYGRIARMFSPGVRQVHTEHSNVEEGRTLAIWGERLASFHTDAIVADALIVRDFLESRVGISRGRIEIVYNGVDVQMYHLPNAEITNRNEYITVGIVARLVAVKNHELLIKAFKKVQEGAPSPVRLVIIGDGPLKGQLKELVSYLGIEGSVEFMGFRRDIPELMRKLDIFVLCSNSEGLSLTLLEAMASGLPVIATDVGGNCEVVHDGINGRIVPAGNVDALVVALKELISNPGLTRAYGLEGRRNIEEKFSLGGMIEKYERIYERVIGL